MEFVAHRNAGMKTGDCGRIGLHAPSGDWIGLVSGQTSTGLALFTRNNHVFGNIKGVTGYKAIEPVCDWNW